MGYSQMLDRLELRQAAMIKKLFGWCVGLMFVMPAYSQPVKAVVSGEKNLVVRLEQASYLQAIEALQKITKVPIHYSILPDQPVSVQCSGQDLHRVLACLFKQSVNMVVHISDDKPSEIWLMPVLGLENAGVEAVDAPAAAKTDSSLYGESASAGALAEISQDHILTMLNGEDPEQRADGMILLAADPRFDDDQANDILLSALHDGSPQVRAQAVQGLVKRQGKAANGLLQTALSDQDEEVRIMVIDNAGGNVELLEQALFDNSKFVSGYAARKLAELRRP